MSPSGNLKDILGINSRNIDVIYSNNNRDDFHLVDNKLETKKILKQAGLPHPRLIKAYEWFWQLNGLESEISKHDSFALKPARGLAGGGITICTGREGRYWKTTAGVPVSARDIKHRALEILQGVHSIDNTTDIVIIEEKINQHPFFSSFYPDGIADIRLIVYRHIPIMAMCRIPTGKSGGKANMTLGAVGAGIDVSTGEMFHAVDKKGALKLHPDTRKPLTGLTIPAWDRVIEISKKVQTVFPLGYLGVDIVIDERKGPLILELNARPGLEIQNANQKGLKAEILKAETAVL